jgi:murein DD-endopeptidase MepM/ murein hydrolase activator NlpD
MLRTALLSLFCWLVLLAPGYSQDVFVPRELKAQAVHPISVKEHNAETKATKPKEVVRRAEAVTEANLKTPAAKESSPASNEPIKSKALKADSATAKAEKTSPKEKSPSAVKTDKAPAATEDLANKKIAKVEPQKVKAEKSTVLKESSEADLPTIKVEKKTAVREAPSVKAVAKTETVKADTSKEKMDKRAPAKEKTATDTAAKTQTLTSETAIAKSEKKSPAKEESATQTAVKGDTVKVETVTAKTEKPTKDKAASTSTAKTQPPKSASPIVKAEKAEIAKAEPAVAKTDKASPIKKEKSTVPPLKATPKSETMIARVEPAPPPREGPVTVVKPPVKTEQISVPSQKETPQIIPAVSSSLDTGFTKIANGFDFPVGKPEAEGYYKARGFRAHGHVGEDWDGVRGGDTDLGDPIYSIGDGIVVFARDVHLGWGNVIIVRHAYRESGTVKYIDALYGHLNTMLVGRGQKIARGQQIATMGNAHGQYDAHLHFEIRKNLEIGMSRSKFQKDFSNYYDPSQFIASHRHLSGGGANYRVAMNTFTQDWTYHFDSTRNFSPRKRSTSESSAALQRALTSTR